MVLIAVAVLVGLWLLYSLTQGDNSADQAADDQVTSAPAVQSDAANTAPADAGTGADTDTGDTEGTEGTEGTDAPAGDTTNSAAEAQPADQPAAAAPGAAAGGVDKEDVTVNVLNNSTVSGLAESIYNDLAEQGVNVGEHGNLGEEVTVLGETTVFYQPGDTAGQEAAQELADRIAADNGVPARVLPNLDNMPEGTAGVGQITLALIGDINV